MSQILVIGHINIETTLTVDTFPVEYAPVRYPFFGIKSTVSGVGLNIARALHTLGHQAHLFSIIGSDLSGTLVRQEMLRMGLSDEGILPQLEQTAQSVILYDQTGRRAIYTDLKDIQQHHYPQEIIQPALETSDIAVICNINYARPVLLQAVQMGKTIASDVHAISNLDDDYNRDWIQHASILFMSHEHLPVPPEQWIRQLWDRYNTQIAVVGLGERGALLGVLKDQRIEHIPAVYTRPVISTIGAGDALFSAFLHTYSLTHDPYLALRKAVVFASYKIGTAGAAEGFIDASMLDQLFDAHTD